MTQRSFTGILPHYEPTPSASEAAAAFPQVLRRIQESRANALRELRAESFELYCAAIAVSAACHRPREARRPALCLWGRDAPACVSWGPYP